MLNQNAALYKKLSLTFVIFTWLLICISMLLRLDFLFGVGHFLVVSSVIFAGLATACVGIILYLERTLRAAFNLVKALLVFLLYFAVIWLFAVGSGSGV